MDFRSSSATVVAMICACLAGAAWTHAGETTGKGFPLRQGASDSYVHFRPADPSGTRHYLPPVPQPAATPVSAFVPAHAATPPAASAQAPTASAQPPATSAQAFESRPLAFPDNPRRASGNGERREFAMPSIWPALLAVMAVCGGFCLVLHLAKKYLPGHRQLFTHPALEVLGRTHLDQKRYVSLLRVGKRIVVVGVSPDEMRPLSEITDEAEITSILEVARPKTESGLSLFQKLFKRNVLDAEAAEAGAMAKIQVEQLDEQMEAMRRRVRAIGGTEGAGARGKAVVDTVG